LKIVVQRGHDPLVDGAVVRRVGSVAGPVRDSRQSPRLKPHAGLAKQFREAVGTRVANRRWRPKATSDKEGEPAIEEIGEAVFITWHDDVQMFANFASQGHALANQIAAVSGQELEPMVDRIGCGFGESEAVDGGSMDGGEVGVVGLVSGIGGLTELLGGEGMDDADLESGGGEGVFDDMMISSGSFDDDDAVKNLMGVAGLAESSDGVQKRRLGVGDFCGRDQDFPIEVCEHPFGPGLGAIDGDDAEVFRADVLDAGMNRAVGLVNLMGPPGATAPCCH
jgi:hypothetical protein